MDKKYDIKFMRANVTVWPKCIDEDYMNVNYIFPTKQKDVCDIIKAVLPDENITRVCIFGSTITKDCNLWDDIDVYFEKRKEGDNPVIENDSVYDFRDNFNTSKEMRREIYKYGIVVYARDSKFRWEYLPYGIRKHYKKW